MPVLADSFYTPQFKIDGTVGGRSLGRVGVLYPLTQQEDSLLYSDFRGMVGDEISEFNLRIRLL